MVTEADVEKLIPEIERKFKKAMVEEVRPGLSIEDLVPSKNVEEEIRRAIDLVKKGKEIVIALGVSYRIDINGMKEAVPSFLAVADSIDELYEWLLTAVTGE